MKTHFSASLDFLHEMLQFVREESVSMGFDEPSSLNIELAVEEALVNIITHGYVDRKGDIEIDCQVFEKSRFDIVIKDTGIEYDPLLAYSASSQNDVGGCGVLLMRNIMDEVSYRREGECNILTLVKKKKTRIVH